MTESAIDWDVDFEEFTGSTQNNESVEFARKRSGGIGASQIHAICTNRPDFSKVGELKSELKTLEISLKKKGVFDFFIKKIESTEIESQLKKAGALTDYRAAESKQRQLAAILNDSLPTGAKELAKRVAMERITGFCEESDVSFDSAATRWGKKYESEAVEELKKRYPDIELMYTGNEQQSFMLDDYAHVWATPDGVIYTSKFNASRNRIFAALDIKCPFNRANHWDNLQIPDWLSFMSLHPDYAYQGVCQMLATGANRFWFVSYDPRFPSPHNLIKHEFELNQADADFMRSRVAMFEAEVLAIMEKLAIC